LIHPVAGRCKHCKEDLSLLRTNRPQAAAVLPSLNGRPTPMPVAGNGTSVHLAAPAAAATAVPLAVDPRDGSAPILPQRTTGHTLSAQSPGGSLLRNWPMLVIILAMIAIVTAVVIMVMPAGNNSAGGARQLMPAPAPDRMETMPDKSSQADPWAQPGDPRNHAAPDPAPRVTPDPPSADDTTNDPDPDPDDLYGGLNTPGLGGGLNGGVFVAMANQACKKLKTCGNVDQSALSLVCDSMAAMPLPPVPSGCASAKRCMDAIDHIDCDMTSTNANPMNMLLLMQDCTKAATEC
jgi:hypothetical protein